MSRTVLGGGLAASVLALVCAQALAAETPPTSPAAPAVATVAPATKNAGQSESPHAHSSKKPKAHAKSDTKTHSKADVKPVVPPPPPPDPGVRPISQPR